ncbi:ABC transporter permease subunit [Bartonella sp. DGB1]|uniref:ABC transporter permease subunit n=1 Tax=Bartonella sp. DGB1 TaxID=3239807 RepID=UPI0035264EE2
MADAIPVSVKLGLYIFVVSLILSITAGIIAALNHNNKWDYSVIGISLIGYIIPNIVLGPMLIYIFAVYFPILPGGGWEGGKWQHMILPVATLALSSLATKARMTRGNMLETLNSNYIRTARAKGLPKYKIILRHALRPALVPLIPTLVFSLIYIWSGTLIIEKVFGLPGVGHLFVNSALNRDYSLSLSLTMLTAISIIVGAIIIDILYTVVDPRLRK